MNFKELDDFLRKITPSEKWHLKNPKKISEFYKKVNKIDINGSLVYLFDFDLKFKKENITINRDSRFTHLPEHTHTDMELNYVYSGSCTYFINGKEIEVNKGDICLLDTNVVHSTDTIGEDDIIINMSMTKSFFNTSFLSRLSNQGIITSFLIDSLMENKSHNRYMVFRANDNTNIDRLMRSLLCEYYDRDIGYDEVINSYTIVIFTELVRVFNRDNKDIINHKRSNDIIHMLQYIENNYNNCTLNSMANNFGYNPNYLGNLLKNETGKTFSELKLEHQLRQASMLICHSQIPIYEIATHVGFSNLGFFYKKFRDMFDVNPQEYRERYL